MKPTLTIKEVADGLRVSEKTVRRAIHAGALPAELVGGRYRFDPTAVEAWAGPAATESKMEAIERRLTELEEEVARLRAHIPPTG